MADTREKGPTLYRQRSPWALTGVVTPVHAPGAEPPVPWHAWPVQATLAVLQTSVTEGLTEDEVAARLTRVGRNELPSRGGRPPWRILLAQFQDVMVLVLLAASVVAAAVGEVGDVVAILVIVVLNAVLGFVQEFRAERAMAALQAMAAVTALVRRHKAMRTVDARDLVPGDIVLLEAGQIVPADVRLVETVRFETDESTLTGESLAVAKDAACGLPEHLPLGDRRSMAYKGTMVASGRAVAAVVATGRATELGRVATLLAAQEAASTPLQQRLAALGRRLAVVVLILCALFFSVGLVRGEPPVLMLLTALSLAVAAIPEALPAVVTIALALGARRMARRHALVRRLSAVETLGSVTFICSDKTGTLTQNRMRVADVRLGHELARRELTSPLLDGEDLGRARERLFEALLSCSDVRSGRDGELIGEPMEVALHAAGRDEGACIPPGELPVPRVGEVPFSSERARMTTLHARPKGFIAYTKGAPERVLERCTSLAVGEWLVPLDPVPLLAEARRMAEAGVRVLAVSSRQLDTLPTDAEVVESEQTLLGFVGLFDPPRDEARAAVEMCRTAGIQVVMITGDHPATAHAIACQVGIAEAGSTVLSGADLAELDDDALAAAADHTRVYARVAPEDKIRIVRALQARGQFVAMTGDGVNDAPALRRAHIGIAMGQGGTDVAREAADVVLLDDNFATIVGATREGRRIYDNIRKFVRYVLTGNVGELWALFVAPLLGLPIPLLPIHILWVNLVTDGLPGLALTAEPEERGVMRRPPRAPAESLFAGGLWQHVFWVGAAIGLVTIAVQTWAWTGGRAHWQSMVFTVLTFSQMAHVLAIRSERESVFSTGMGGNRPLLGAVALTLALQLGVLYVPAAQAIFKTEPLSAVELLICALAAAIIFTCVEAEKWMIRRGWIYTAGGKSPPTRAVPVDVRDGGSLHERQ